jgi:electron transfer flavoprotein alpha subunit
MGEIFVLVEHRQGKLRDVTYEMLGAADRLAAQQGAALTAVLLGKGVKNFAEELATRAPKVLVVEDESLENFNSALYQKALSSLLSKYIHPCSHRTFRFWNGLSSSLSVRWRSAGDVALILS